MRTSSHCSESATAIRCAVPSIFWSLDDVATHADAILERLEAGTMPCDGPWPAERVAVFRQWIDGGKPA